MTINSKRITHIIIRILLVAICSTAAMRPASADTFLGGSWDNRLVFETIDGKTSSWITSRSTLQVISYQPAAVFQSKFSLEETFLQDNKIPKPVVSVDEFKVEFYPSDAMTLRLGSFRHIVGQSEVFNPLATFSQKDLAAVFSSGRISDMHHPEYLMQASLYSRDFSTTLTVSPIFPAYRQFPTDSPWFPMKDIPEKISFKIRDRVRDFELNEILYTNELVMPVVQPFSLQFEFSGFSSRSDWTVLIFDGWNRNRPLRTKVITVPFSLAEYNLELTPLHERVQAFGSSFGTTAGSMRFFSDMLITFNRTFTTYGPEELDRIVQADSLELSAGASIDVPGINSFFQVEYARLFVPDAEELTIVTPAFSHMISLLTDTYSDSRKVSLRTMSILSVSDWSLLIVPDISLDVSQEFSAVISSAFFIGGSDTEFGQFRNNRLTTVSCVLRL